MPAKSLRTPPGAPHPLGATCDGAGVDFALFSEHADAVDRCLFEPTLVVLRLWRSRRQS
jgi:isoamylase